MYSISNRHPRCARLGNRPSPPLRKEKGKKKQDAECVGDPKEREENCRQPLLVVEEQETATPERAASPERTNARAIHGTSGTGRPQPAVGARRPVKTARRRTPPCPVAPVPQSVDRCAVVSSSCLQRSGALALALLCSSASQPFTPASTYHAARHFPFSFFLCRSWLWVRAPMLSAAAGLLTRASVHAGPTRGSFPRRSAAAETVKSPLVRGPHRGNGKYSRATREARTS
jgi:hypothetical protein